MMFRSAHFIFASVALFAAARDAALRVRITDPSGAVIPAANISVEVGGVERAARTDSQGQAEFQSLTPGRVRLRIEADGFASEDVPVTIGNGWNRLERQLHIASRNDEISVAVDPVEAVTDPRGPAFSTVLTEAQIAQLPDDPDEMERVLKEMGGPGAVIRVDGFRGGHLPHKSQIHSIRFRLTPYSAEEHDDGFALVDIETKPGLGAWHGTASFGFGDSALNARNYFAPAVEPQQTRRIDLTLTGPLLQKRTSASFWFSRNSSFDSKANFGVLPSGPFSNLTRLPADITNANVKIDHALSRSHVLRAMYQYAGERRSGIGVFDLPERYFDTTSDQHVLRFSDNGTLTPRLANEFRFQTQWTETGARSANSAPANVVLSAFSSGGAGMDNNRRAREMDLTDHLSFNKGRHSMRVGGEFDSGWYRDRDNSNANGTFIFPSIAAYVAGRPLTWSRRTGNVLVNYSQQQFGTYFQDDIRLAKNVTLSAGVRVETQTNMADRNNVAPRVGIVWSPFKDGKTVIRAGGGVFYQWYGAETFEETLRVNGSRQSDQVVTNPGYPDPLSGTSASTILPPSVIRQSSALRMPYVLRTSVGVQRNLLGRFMLMSDLRYQHGVHLLRAHDINAPVLGVRPDAGRGNILQIESTAQSFMKALNVTLGPAPTRMGRRVFWTASYLLSKSVDETNRVLDAPMNNFDLRADRGPSLTDARHRFFAMGNFTLPKGLQLGTFFNASSAMPYNVITGFDNNGDSAVNDRPNGLGRNSARGSATWNFNTRVSWSVGWGKVREDSGPGSPRLFRLRLDDQMPDLPGGGGSKPSRYRVQFYAQGFNVLNHSNLNGYVGVLSSPLFGLPTSAMQPRRLEVGTKFTF